jgi:hypothetical protein
MVYFVSMSQAIDSIKSSLEHIKGQMYWLKQDPSKELQHAIKQGESTLKEFENEDLKQIIKAME